MSIVKPIDHAQDYSHPQSEKKELASSRFETKTYIDHDSVDHSNHDGSNSRQSIDSKHLPNSDTDLIDPNLIIRSNNIPSQHLKSSSSHSSPKPSLHRLKIDPSVRTDQEIITASAIDQRVRPHPPTPADYQLPNSNPTSTDQHEAKDVAEHGPSKKLIPDSTPGQLIDSPVTNRLPDWYRVGWASQIDSVDLSKLERDDAHHLDLLETFVSEIYYGTWFHNAAIIFFAVAASHYITLFGGGWSGLIIILSICTTYYSTSIRRVRKNARGDIARELAKQRLFQDHETADWFNNFLNRFWLIYEPVLSATIVASVDQILVASTPSFLESIRMTTFTLGSKAPRIDFIRSHPETENDVVVMDWKFDFTPNDVSDMPTKVAASKINPKIVLTIRFGKGVIGAAKDIVVENISFTGTIRIRIKLMNNFPHLQLIDLSFLEKPEFDFILKPVGFDLNMIPGLSGFIESQVHATLGPMMYDPNVFTLNLEQMLAGALVDSAVGVLQITVTNAQGLKSVKIGGGTPDPYVTFSIGARLNLDRTKVKRATTSPVWKSVHFLLIHSLNEILTLEVMDYNEVRKDTSLGTASVDLQSLVLEPEQDGVTLPVVHQGKPRGEIRLSMVYHPCLVPKQLENGETEPVPETTTGIARLVLHQAKDLDYKRSGTSNLSPYGKIYFNREQILKTPIIKRTNHPVYEASIETLVTNKAGATFTIDMFDDRHGEDAKIGSVTAKLTDLIDLTAGEQKLDWFSLVGAKSGKLRISVTWKGLMMAGAINGASAYTPPIGVLRFHFDKAEDLKNVEALTGGKSDPYVRIMRSGITLARSQIHNSNLDPVFDEIIYVPIHSLKDLLRLEVMDYQHLTKDRSLGHLDMEMTKLVESIAEEGLKSYKSTGKHQFSQYLKQEGKKATFKGRLDFTAEFYACQQIKFRPFDTPPSDVEIIKSLEHTSSNTSLSKLADQYLNQSINRLPNGISPNGKSPAGDQNGSGQLGYQISDSPSGKSPRPKDSTATSADSRLQSQPSVHSMTGSVTAIASSISIAEKTHLKELSKDELLSHQSGILVFNIIGGTIARKSARLEFLLDDGYWPSYSTEPAKSTNPKWDETGESFIRELDWSRCTMKLNVADKDTREEVYAEFSCDLKTFLDDCLDAPHDFTLEDVEGGNRSTVSIQCRYIPVPITLEPRESINNMGLLTVLVDHAHDLMAADRNGYSDPYAQFILNGQKVFKSSVQKKTLNPKWMERFEVEIPSRANAEFYIQVFDWDRVGTSDKLGQAKIDLSNLEPMVQSTFVAHLVLGDRKQGQVQIRMTFRPHFISRSRHATSTFASGFGRVATGLGGTVLSAGAGVGVGAAKGVGTVGGGVLKGVGGVGKFGYAGIKRAAGIGNKRTSVISDEVPTVPVIEPNSNLVNGVINPSQAAATSTPTVAPQSPAASSKHKNPNPVNDYKLNVVIVSAAGLENTGGKTYVQMRRNGKAVYDTKVVKQANAPEWNEACTLDIKLGVDSEIEAIMFDKKKLGKDREIGGLKINVWDLLQPETGKMEVEIEQPIEHPNHAQANGGGGHPTGEVGSMTRLRLKLSIIESGSSTNVGKDIYGVGSHSRRSISGPIGHHLPFLFGNSSSLGRDHQPGLGSSQGATSAGENLAAATAGSPSHPSELFLNHDPNPSVVKVPSIFGGRSHKSLSHHGGSRFSLHRH